MMLKFSLTVVLCLFPFLVKAQKDDGGGRRRELLALAPAISSECLKEDYKLYLFVEEGQAHIDLIASLDAEEPILECAMPLVFTDIGGGMKALAPATGNGGYLEDLDWANQASVEDLGALPLGTFSLEALKLAMEASSAVEAGRYNVLTDNCATFILGMMQELDIPANKRVREFVVDTIESKDPAFVSSVRGNPGAKAYFGVALEKMADREVLSMLVDFYVKMHYPTSSE